MKKKVIFILVVIIILVSVILFFNMKKNNTENLVENSNVKKEYCTYLVYNSVEIDNPDLDSVNMVFAFNSKNVCVDCRMVWTFSTEELAKENYENWKKCELSNLKIESNTVSFNDDVQPGRTKDEIRKIGFGNYKISEY